MEHTVYSSILRKITSRLCTRIRW